MITLSIFSLWALKLLAFLRVLLKFFSCFIDSLTAGWNTSKWISWEDDFYCLNLSKKRRICWNWCFVNWIILTFFLSFCWFRIRRVSNRYFQPEKKQKNHHYSKIEASATFLLSSFFQIENWIFADLINGVRCVEEKMQKMTDAEEISQRQKFNYSQTLKQFLLGLDKLLWHSEAKTKRFFHLISADLSSLMRI